MGVLRVRVNDAWEKIAGNNEVLIGNIDPYATNPDADEELWFNTLANQLFVRVNGRWQAAVDDEVVVSRADPAPLGRGTELWYDVDASPAHGATSDQIANEVHVGASDPLLVNPTAELWYDTSTVPSTLRAKVNGTWTAVASPPAGGTTNQALTKVDGVDGNTRWGGDLDVNGVIQFPNTADVAKVNLYDKTFGLGIESGTTTIFGSSRVRFRVGTPADPARGGITSPTVAEIDASGLGPRTSINVSWQNGFTGTAQFRVNPAMVTLALWNFTNGVELLSFNPIKMFDYPAGVPAPWANCSGAVMPIWMGSTFGYLPLRVDCRTDGVFMYAADYFQPGDLWDCACTVTWAR